MDRSPINYFGPQKGFEFFKWMNYFCLFWAINYNGIWYGIFNLVHCVDDYHKGHILNNEWSSLCSGHSEDQIVKLKGISDAPLFQGSKSSHHHISDAQNSFKLLLFENGFVSLYLCVLHNEEDEADKTSNRLWDFSRDKQLRKLNKAIKFPPLFSFPLKRYYSVGGHHTISGSIQD